MASGGGSGGGGGGGGGSTPPHFASHHSSVRIVRPDDIVHGFVLRHNRRHSGVFNPSPMRRRRAPSTSSSASTVSHTGSLGLVDSFSSWTQNTPTSPLHNLHGLQQGGQYGGFRASPSASSIHRKRSLGDSSGGYPSPRLAHTAAVGSAGFASSSPLPPHHHHYQHHHSGVRNTSSVPMAATSPHAPPHSPAYQTSSFPLSAQLHAASCLAPSTDEYGETIHQQQQQQHHHYQQHQQQHHQSHNSAAQSSACAGTGVTHSSKLSPPDSLDLRPDGREKPCTSTAVAGANAAACAPAKTVCSQMSIDDGYDGSSEHLASAASATPSTRPKTRQDKDSSKKPLKTLKDTLKRRKAKPDAKRRDDGGLSDIAASAAPSQCTTPVPVAADDDCTEESIPGRKISNGNSPSPTEEDSKRKSEAGSLLGRANKLMPKFFRSTSRDASGNLSDGASSDSTKKKKRRAGRKKKTSGHTRHRSEDLNNNEPGARADQLAERSAAVGRKSSAPSPPASGFASASASASAATASSAADYSTSNVAEPYADSSSDEAVAVLAAAGGEFGNPSSSLVSSLRDDLSQELLLDSGFPTPGPSNPATPGSGRRRDSDQMRRRSRPYSSDVDTGEQSYDVVADSISFTSEPAGPVRGHRPRLSSGEVLTSEEEALEAAIDKLTDLSEHIEAQHNDEISRIVERLLKAEHFRSYADFEQYAIELLGRIGIKDTDFNMMILLVMTSQLLKKLPINYRHLQVEIERHSSRLLKEYFFEYFCLGTEKAWSFIRRSLRRRGDVATAEEPMLSSSQGAAASPTSASAAATAFASSAAPAAAAAAASGTSAAHSVSPLASLGETNSGTPTLRLRGAQRGQSAREARGSQQQRLQQQRDGSGMPTPSPRLRLASSAPRLAGYLDPPEQEQQQQED